MTTSELNEITTLTNGIAIAKFSSFGAELQSLSVNGKEHIWNGDKQYWGRRAPILFPFVGGLSDDGYLYNGEKYPMLKHGFARDSMFDIVSYSDTSVKYKLDTYKDRIYPFNGILYTTYELIDTTIKVTFTISNNDEKPLYYSIGWHPALLYPDQENDSHSIMINTKRGKDVFTYRLFGDDLLISSEFFVLNAPNGRISISNSTFDRDVLIIDAENITGVSVLDAEEHPFTCITFDAPLLGLWAPKGKSPFICIEPWYGSDDYSGFKDELSRKPYIQRVEPAGEQSITCKLAACSSCD